MITLLRDYYFFFQAEDGIRDLTVTGVQTCALPILAKVAPELAGRPIAVNERVVTSDPRFFQGSAVIDSAFVVKFAWSEPAARRVALEGGVLTALRLAAPDLAIPEVVAASADPALVVTLRIRGEALTSEAADR